MNTFALKVTSLALFLLLITPAGASAYRFVNSSTAQVNDTTYLLTYTYTAGFSNNEALFPIVAAPTDAAAADYPRVEYALTSDDEDIEVSSVHALVLSEADIVDNQYQTKEGKSSTFTLMALATLKQPITTKENLALALRYIPFNYTKNGENKTAAYQIE